jgi:hypothetical protein
MRVSHFASDCAGHCDCFGGDACCWCGESGEGREPTDGELDAVLEKISERERLDKLDQDDADVARRLVGDYSKGGEP